MEENGVTTRESRWDARSFCALVEQERPRLLACIRRRMGPTLRAVCEPEDVLQEACLAGLGALDRLPSCRASEARAWLLCIARHRVLDLSRGLRRRRRPQRGTPLPASHLQLGLEESALRAPPTTTDDALEDLRDLRGSMGRLAFEQRTAVVLRECLDLPWPTIALVLHRSTSAARKLHERARLRLRRAARRSG